MGVFCCVKYLQIEAVLHFFDTIHPLFVSNFNIHPKRTHPKKRPPTKGGLREIKFSIKSRNVFNTQCLNTGSIEEVLSLGVIVGLDSNGSAVAVN